MKIQRYIAADMRGALRQIREQQGPDAVILSTRPVPSGVEVCAAVDVEFSGGALSEAAALKQLEQDLAQAPIEPPPAPELALQSSAPLAAALGDPSVSEELRSLRGLLEQQLAALAWNDFTRRAPHKARALADLAALGVSRELALAVVAELPPELGIEQAQRLPYALLARRIATCGAPGENGGALALLGPPGCGKTTTLAKLAARWVLERDPADLLLISTDEERLGSHEQLRALGRVLGARVEVCADPTMLAALVQVLPAGTLALIDTAGHSPQGGGEGEVRALRDASSRLQTVLVLPASAQTGFIEDVLAQPLAKQALCCVLTRVDEAVSLGGALSAVARAGLPLAWVSDGPRIPEDLKPARAHQLVARAVELARQSPAHADDELLARRYGGSLGAAA